MTSASFQIGQAKTSPTEGRCAALPIILRDLRRANGKID
jgi:hypothetical protein